MQMCRPCTHIIIVQIMINSAKLHSIIIYKHEMDLKLYALKFKVRKWITRFFFKLLKYKVIVNINILPKLFVTQVFFNLKKSSS
jgi:hypothetical protein